MKEVGISNKQNKRLLLQIFKQQKHRQTKTTSVTKIVCYQFQLQNKFLKICTLNWNCFSRRKHIYEFKTI